MKKNIIFPVALAAFLVLPFVPAAQTDAGGIGINMENPLGAFHLDGGFSTATTNPLTDTPPTPAQQVDDVIVTHTGQTGIGTTSPSTRLEINTRGQTGVVPLRIMDGSQGVGKILMSDDQGVATWQTYTAPGTVPDVVYPIRTMNSQSFTINTPAEVNESSFTVPDDGFYSAEIRWWGDFNGSSAVTPPFKGVFIFQLRRTRSGNVEVVDEFICHEYTQYRVTAFTALYAKASQGDVLSVWVNTTHGVGLFRIGVYSNMNWVKSRILYKRLGLEDGTSYFD